MKLKDIITVYRERGGFISEPKIYNNYGTIPVYSANTTGHIGYYNDWNYTTTPYTLIYTLNGVKAGSVLLTSNNKKIWFSTDTGVIEIEPLIYEKYKRDTVATYLQYLFMNNRHNNGGQPKFSLKRCLDLDIDESMLDFIEKQENTGIKNEIVIKQDIKKLYSQLTNIEENNTVFKDIIESYKERGKRLTHGKDLYPNYGGVKVISADIYGAMGYYNSSNYSIKENSFIYTIDGKNAGSILLLQPQDIWITDHAGVININKDFVEQYGKFAIATYLQKTFYENRDGTGTRPQFLLKKVLNTPINTYYLKVLSDMKLERILR